MKLTIYVATELAVTMDYNKMNCNNGLCSKMNCAQVLMLNHIITYITALVALKLRKCLHVLLFLLLCNLENIHMC